MKNLKSYFLISAFIFSLIGCGDDSLLEAVKPTASATPAPSSASLVLHLDAASASGNTNYTAGTCTDTTWFDLTANHIDGTLVGFSGCDETTGWDGDGVTNISGTAGPYRLMFNGGNNVDFGVSAPLHLTTGLTITAWIKASANGAIFTSYDAGGSYAGYGFEIGTGNTGNLGFWSNGQNAWVGSSGNSVTDDVWHHVAVTYDGTTAVIYKDGVQVFTGAVLPPGITTHSSVLGMEPQGGTGFNGAIADFRVYDGALLPAEISQNCNLLAARFAGAVCN